MDKDIKSQLEKIIDVIKKNRKTRGLSHENMAIELDISPSTYNKIERQDIKLSLERFLEIKSLLKIPVEDLFEISVENIYNQSFNDSSIFHQEVQNLYHDNKELTNGYIESLKTEIAFLKSILNKNTE